MKKTGYKGMLRDRVPKMVDFALKWCKAKERWIDHAYNHFIKFYVKNEQRNSATRIVLGKKKQKHFDFDKSIDWDNLTIEETLYWKRVSGWVRWFCTRYAYIENTYQISRENGKDEEAIKVEIIKYHLSSLLPSQEEPEEEKQVKYAYVDRLVDFLMKCLKETVKEHV